MHNHPVRGRSVRRCGVVEGDRSGFGFLRLLVPADWVGKAVTLRDGTRVVNAAAEDNSTDVNVFLAVYEAGGYPEVLEVATPSGDERCTFEPPPTLTLEIPSEAVRSP